MKPLIIGAVLGVLVLPLTSEVRMSFVAGFMLGAMLDAGIRAIKEMRP